MSDERPPVRFRERTIDFDGARVEDLEIPSADPRNYYDVISQPEAVPRRLLDGKLFTPSEASGPLPVVILVPGSLGVAESHIEHAKTLVAAGIAAFVLDNFGARNVTSTVANQTQFSFAASAYDVLAAYEVLAAHPMIDGSRIGAQGHSRGGSAVLSAATRVFADAVLDENRALAGVLAAYPWCGHQFLDPRVGSTRVHVSIGDLDEWCLPQQAQGHCQAIRLTGGDATIRIHAKAHHSFDRGTAIQHIPDAKISPGAPTGYLDDSGAFLHPTGGEPDPDLVDRDLMVYALKAGYGKVGAHIGSTEGQAELFRDEMLGFWARL